MFKLLPESLLSSQIPFRRMIREQGVVSLDDGSVIAMIEVAGRPWQTAERSWINAWRDRLNQTFRNLHSDRLVIMTYECRGLANRAEYPKGKFRSAFAESLDIAYADRLFDRMMYRNRLYIVAQIRPFRPAGEWVGDQMARRRWRIHEPTEERIRMLERTVDLLMTELNEYRPRRLSTRQPIPGRAIYNEIAEALVFAMTGLWRPVGLTEGRMGNAMFSERLTFGRETIEIRGPGLDVYAGMLSFKEYPAQTWPQMFETFRAIAPYRFTLTNYFRFMGKGEARDRLTRKQNRHQMAESRALKQVADLDDAVSDLEANEFVYGDHNMSLCVFSDSVDGMKDVAHMAWGHLADAGAVAIREDKGIQAAWFSMIPGNSHLRVRPGAVSSRNLASFAPLHNFPDGPERGYWGDPICMFRTSGGTPYRFHMHVGDVGNIFVTGSVGSGKTVSLAFLIAQAEKAGAQAVVWDKDRGLEIAVRALAGNYNALDNPTWLSPLKALTSAPHDLSFLAALIRSLIDGGKGYKMTQEEDRRLSIALRTVMSLRPELRKMGEVRGFLGCQPEGAGTRLEKWCWGNEFGWVLDCPEDRVRLDAPVIGFDQTKFLDDKDARGPIMAYLFHRVESLIDGRRLLFVIDEFWKALQDEAFRDLVHDKLKTLRKRNSPVILATQSPRDALNSPIAHTIREQTPTHLHFSNHGATSQDYGEKGIGLTEPEVRIVRTLPQGSGMFLLKQDFRSVIAQIPLTGMEEELAVLSGREANVRILDQVRREIGEDDPTRLLEAFHVRRREVVL